MQYFGERLKAARKIKGWSLQDLADQTSNAITKQALSKYEADFMHPSRKILLLLAAALGVKPSYFEQQPAIKLPAFEFARKGSVPVKQVDSFKEKIKNTLERYLQIEDLLNIHTRFSNPVKSIPVPDEATAVALASKVLNKWDLGWSAHHNVMATLELKGIRVIPVESPAIFDGLSTIVGRVPVIVLHQDRPAEFQRFGAMYELGQLILKIPAGVDRDKICQAFAGAMLLPGDNLETIIGPKRMAIAPGELICIKEQFGLPAQAIMKQAILKGIIDKKEANPFFKQLADNKDEIGLGHYRGQEKCVRFERMILKLAAEEIVNVEELAVLADIPAEELKKKLELFEELV